MKKVLFYSLLSALLFLFASCNEEQEQNLSPQEQSKTYRVHLEVQKPTLDGETRANGNKWEDGDWLIVAFANKELELYGETSGTMGQLTYQGASGEWLLSFFSQGASSQDFDYLLDESFCNVFYVQGDGIVYSGEEYLDIDERTAFFADYDGSYKKVGQEVYVKAHLQPWVWKLAFKGDKGRSVTLLREDLSDQEDVYPLYFIAQLRFIIRRPWIYYYGPGSEDINLTVNENGFTDYIHGVYNDPKFDNFYTEYRRVAIMVDGTKYYRNLETAKLPVGHSGYFNLPTATNLHGWSCEINGGDVDFGLDGYDPDKDLDDTPNDDSGSQSDSYDINLEGYRPDKNLD